MLYLDYSRKPGEWMPNRYGGRENLEAIEFLRQLNTAVGRYYPGAMTFAEESTAFPGVTQPAHLGGLGFHFKWNMGWMNDTLRYVALDPVHRRFHHSADHVLVRVCVVREVRAADLARRGRARQALAARRRCRATSGRQRANYRWFRAFMTAHPGKKLLFMGTGVRSVAGMARRTLARLAPARAAGASRAARVRP